MKRFSNIELLGIVFGIAIFVFGIWEVIWPKEGVMFLFVNNKLGSPVPVNSLDVNTTGARIYGVLEIFGGIALVVLSAYRSKK